MRTRQPTPAELAEYKAVADPLFDVLRAKYGQTKDPEWQKASKALDVLTSGSSKFRLSHTGLRVVK